MIAVGLLGAGLAGAASHPGELHTHTVTVTPGETLWGIASDAAGDGDIRAMQQEIVDLNGLESATVYAGQHLRVPVR
jgi:LysM repeat protein